MSTQLASSPVMDGQLDLLTQVADNVTPLGTLHRDDFRAACEAVADENGFVHPNGVSLLLRARFGEVNPRWFSSQWAPACGRNGFMDKTDVMAPILAEVSKGNGNKSVALRRLRAAA
jgi:predicted ATP-grasp superfamily ATP-dependent carboligase